MHLRPLKGPGRMMNFHSGYDPVTAWSIEAVSLCCPVLKGPFPGVKYLADWTIGCLETHASALPQRCHFKSSRIALQAHPRLVIGQAVEHSAAENEGPGIGIETKEPHTRFSPSFDVGSEIQFRKGRPERQGWTLPPAHIVHAKRDQSYPCGAVVGVKFQPFRQAFSQGPGVNRIVEKGKVHPLLSPSPVFFGQRPRSMLRLMECRVHDEGERGGKERTCKCKEIK